MEASSSRAGEDDEFSTFYPTVAELEDLTPYITKNIKLFKRFGIIKMRVPENARLPDIQSFIIRLPKDKTEDRDGRLTTRQSFKYSSSNKNGVYILETDYVPSPKLSLKQIFEERSKLAGFDGYPQYQHTTSEAALATKLADDKVWKGDKSTVEAFSGIDKKLEDFLWQGLEGTREAPRLYDAERDITSYSASMEPTEAPTPNLADLRDTLACLRHTKDRVFHGINTPYTYFGAPETFFTLHLEDLDFMSINICQAGAPKVWYGLKGGQSEKLKSVLKDLYPDEYQKCPLYHRHKRILVKPSVLQSLGVEMTRLVQYPREIVLTMPHSFHQGVNFGVNIHEAVNLAVSEWESYGEKAEVCSCDETKYAGWGYMAECLSQDAGITLSACQEADFRRYNH